MAAKFTVYVATPRFIGVTLHVKPANRQSNF